MRSDLQTRYFDSTSLKRALGVLVALSTMGIVACDDDDEIIDPADEYDLAFEGDASFAGYWIDSHFGDGTEGTCDEPPDDHQWRIDATDDASLGNVAGPVTIADSHRLTSRTSARRSDAESGPRARSPPPR